MEEKLKVAKRGYTRTIYEDKRVRRKTGGMDRVPGTSGDAIGFWEPGEGGGGKCL